MSAITCEALRHSGRQATLIHGVWCICITLWRGSVLLLLFGPPQAGDAQAGATPPSASTSQYAIDVDCLPRLTSGVMDPSGRGGVASTMVWHPAMAAGTASMRALDGRTAVPPGT
jgi:hypothetical protein